MTKLIAFLRRDFQSMISYRFRILLKIISLAITVTFVFFIGKTFQGTISVQLERYGNDYFAFAILGLALSSFISTGLYSFSGQIRDAQVEGTFEALLMTPTPVYTILIGNSLWSFIRSFAECAIFLAVSIFILQLSVSVMQILFVTVVLLLTFAAFLSIGLVSASFTLVFKQGNPINLIFGASSFFLGGILIPVDVLPSWMQWFSRILPITHSGHMVREFLLVSPENWVFQSNLLFLLIFTLLTGPVSFLIFNLALKRAKKDGSLVQY